MRGLELNYDKTAVSHWLSGTQPREPIRYLIIEALSQKLGRPVTLIEAGFATPGEPECAARSLAYSADINNTVNTLTELGLGLEDMNRRTMLQLAPFVASAMISPQRGWMISALENSAQRLADSGVKDTVVGLRSMIGIFDELDNRYGGGYAKAATIHYMTVEVLPLLDKSHPAPVRTQLFVSAAKLAAMTGWMCYDDGHYGLAQRYMIQALRLCEEGRDVVLGGQILAGLSHLATTMGNPEEGVQLARVGLATTTGSGSSLGLMRLHAMRARAHAALGEQRETVAAISNAESALDRSKGPDGESEWVRYLNQAYLSAEMACCFRDLGDSANAGRFASSSTQRNGQLGRRQAISQSVLACAQLQQGNLDLALTTATDAVRRLGTIKSDRSLQALRDFSRRLEPYRKEVAVRTFRHESRALLGFSCR
ncbi:hypothetical protein [Allokutzneria oryzae]|uniref:Transcriptional regulator n=1 Tax=Allokutzneria oryzae TaxID=1378989 RepID=A0ABV5ZU51_9PSEU